MNGFTTTLDNIYEYRIQMNPYPPPPPGNSTYLPRACELYVATAPPLPKQQGGSWNALWGCSKGAESCDLADTGGEGASCGNYVPPELRKIHYIFNSLIVRHLVGPRVAACCSCFQTHQVSASKKHIKVKFQLKCLKQFWQKTKKLQYLIFFYTFLHLLDIQLL